jgi:hypothetical protein
MFKKLRSTQRKQASGAPGHLPGSPSANNEVVNFGPRTGRETVRLTTITSERTRTNPHPLARRFTKFIQNFKGQIDYPRNILSKDRDSSGEQPDAPRKLNVGQIPED